jgi:hypothetical protein
LHGVVGDGGGEKENGRERDKSGSKMRERDNLGACDALLQN